MKKIVLLFLCLVLALTLVSCKKKETFRATVVEVNGDDILVSPLEGESELNSSDQFSINGTSVQGTSLLQVGDVLEITYNGEILETYPAQLGKIYTIAKIEE